MTINDKQDSLIEDFAFFDDWMSKYDYIIQLGKQLNGIDDKFKKDEFLIKGCQSNVWLGAELKDGKVVYTADSDAIITKGLVAMMIEVLSDQKPEDIVNSNLYFVDEIGLKEHLSPTRANGLVSMIKQIKMYALAFANKS